MVDAGPQSPSITGHIVLLPSTNPHRTLRALRPLGREDDGDGSPEDMILALFGAMFLV
jgi:hypothetical protein